MLAVKPQTLTKSFLGFAHNASNILHIKSDSAHEEALAIREHQFDEAKYSYRRYIGTMCIMAQ